MGSESLSSQSTPSDLGDEHMSAMHSSQWSGWKPTDLVLPVLVPFPTPSYSEPIRMSSMQRTRLPPATPRTDQDAAAWTEAEEEESEPDLGTENVVASGLDGQTWMVTVHGEQPHTSGYVCGAEVSRL